MSDMMQEGGVDSGMDTSNPRAFTLKRRRAASPSPPGDPSKRARDDDIPQPNVSLLTYGRMPEPFQLNQYWYYHMFKWQPMHGSLCRADTLELGLTVHNDCKPEAPGTYPWRDLGACGPAAMDSCFWRFCIKIAFETQDFLGGTTLCEVGVGTREAIEDVTPSQVFNTAFYVLHSQTLRNLAENPTKAVVEDKVYYVYTVNLALFLDFPQKKLSVVSTKTKTSELLDSMPVETTVELFPMVRMMPKSLCNADIAVTVVNDVQSIMNSPLAVCFLQK